MLLRVVGLLRALLSADPSLSANPTTTVNINFSLWLCGAGGREALLLRQVGGSIPRRYIFSRFAHDLNCAHSSNCAHSLGTVRTIFWMCYYCCLHYTAFNGKSVFSHGASGSAFDSSTLASSPFRLFKVKLLHLPASSPPCPSFRSLSVLLAVSRFACLIFYRVSLASRVSRLPSRASRLPPPASRLAPPRRCQLTLLHALP